MAAQFVVAIIFTTTAELGGVLRLARNWVCTVRPMSHRTRVPTRCWQREKS